MIYQLKRKSIKHFDFDVSVNQILLHQKIKKCRQKRVIIIWGHKLYIILETEVHKFIMQCLGGTSGSRS